MLLIIIIILINNILFLHKYIETNARTYKAKYEKLIILNNMIYYIILKYTILLL